ncbi:hypothetical protein CmeUKMEL1_07880 [Cryptosporidium meleagridis]|uniref:Uncharacterized protein n=1 Tax=Cryptosporidium meleagridis TaxID=93969 RepID=A0A2P4Z0C4_9CRYT|nr:hypothetical protein CmeUKMEL1_07880 [Cryptosporidium meleagridis]
MLLNKNSSLKSFCFAFLILFYLCIYLNLYEEKIVTKTYTISLVKLQALPDTGGINQENANANSSHKNGDNDQTKTENASGVVGGGSSPGGHPRSGASGLVILSVVDMDVTKNKEGKNNKRFRTKNRSKKGSRWSAGRKSLGSKSQTDSGNEADCECSE